LAAGTSAVICSTVRRRTASDFDEPRCVPESRGPMSSMPLIKEIKVITQCASVVTENAFHCSSTPGSGPISGSMASSALHYELNKCLEKHRSNPGEMFMRDFVRHSREASSSDSPFDHARRKCQNHAGITEQNRCFYAVEDNNV